jgi:hypothetical protein
MNLRTGTLGQGSQDRTAGTGQVDRTTGQNSRNIIARNRFWTEWPEQEGQSSWCRTNEYWTIVAGYSSLDAGKCGQLVPRLGKHFRMFTILDIVGVPDHLEQFTVSS